MRPPKKCKNGPVSCRHSQSAVGVGHDAENGQQKKVGGLTERNSGSFRFWHDERRFKGGAEKCLVQQALFAAGGVRTGGYPKAAPVSGPLGCQRVSDWDMLWSPARSALRAVPHLKPGQLVSAVPGMFSLTKKRRLSTTLSAAYGDAAWQLVPQSYSLPTELPLFRAWLDEQAAAGVDPGPWMLKTAQHLGKGLVLLPGEAAYQAAQQPRLPSAKPFVLAQRYVSNPLLINGCKFGIRLWLLVTGIDPFTSYLHRRGLVLFSTDSYDLESLSDDEGAAGRGHITNYAQNVNGTVWSLEMLKEHLGPDVYKQLWNKLVSSAAFVACGAMGEARQEHSKAGVPPNATFELLGLDYLVDDTMHPWLLEVNGTPSLAVEHGDAPVEQLIHDTKSAMVQDMVNILGCSQRFLPRYGQLKAGVKLSPQQARRVQQSLLTTDDAAAKKRVDAELKHRGGFLPLMGHYPVLQYGSAVAPGGASSQAAAGSSQHSSSSDDDDDDESGTGSIQGSAGANNAAAAAAAAASTAEGEASNTAAAAAAAAPAEGPSAAANSRGGVPFSDRDKRLYVYMQQWWQKQRKLVVAKKKLKAQQQNLNEQSDAKGPYDQQDGGHVGEH